jgi:hypothetical protein
MPRPEILTTWNNEFFDGKLSDGAIKSLAELPTERGDVVSFIDRHFRLMRRGAFDATDFSPMLGMILGSLLSRILPGGWSGRIPPITLASRHVLFDEYILRNRWRRPDAGLYLDIGCGFPPLTTLDSVAAFPDWQIVAADPSMPSHVVYDAEQNYATFGAGGDLYYLQPSTPTIENWNALLADRAETEAHFHRLRAQLLPQLGDAAEVSLDGARLVDPMRFYASDHLSFQAAGIGEVDICDVDIARCFNVLYYFNADFRQQAMTWFCQVLREGGLLLIGGDWAYSTESRYSVYQKVGEDLVQREFAFSVDNLVPLTTVPWFTLVEDDFETLFLADLAGTIRSNAGFLSKLYDTSDALRSEYKLSPRGPDGHYAEGDLQTTDFWQRARDLSRVLDRELAAATVEVLNTSGHRAWVNDLGHIAVDVPPGVDGKSLSRSKQNGAE